MTMRPGFRDFLWMATGAVLLLGVVVVVLYLQKDPAQQLALQARAPVIPVAMIGTFNIMSRHDKFPNFHAKCRVRIGKPIDLSFFYGHERNRETLRYLTDAVIMRRIGELMKRP